MTKSKVLQSGDRVCILSIPGLKSDHELVGKYGVVSEVIASGNTLRLKNKGFLYNPDCLKFIRTAEQARAAAAKQRAKKRLAKSVSSVNRPWASVSV
ncbi:MAG: hypothetical protein M0P95_17860 [Sulfuritalea sp.]|jgi:hypothetical protein|nr:hypothetical protein [Sulfuritalea sp.]